MATDTTEQEDAVTESASADEQDWGRIGLAVLISVLASLVVHYFVVANIDLHPTTHALVGIVLFFVAGIIMFKIVLF